MPTVVDRCIASAPEQALALEYCCNLRVYGRARCVAVFVQRTEYNNSEERKLDQA
jgi:hypothetical protein